MIKKLLYPNSKDGQTEDERLQGVSSKDASNQTNKEYRDFIMGSIEKVFNALKNKLPLPERVHRL